LTIAFGKFYHLQWLPCIFYDVSIFTVLGLFLIFMAYFFVALLAVMYKSFTKLKFFMSWWAFTFPLAAASIASTVAFQVTHMLFFKVTAWALLISAIVAIS
jgi:tellurite resistance protein